MSRYALLLCLLPPAAPLPIAYPLFKQCDSRWGGNAMGTPGAGERSTLCGEGCAVTSLSMVLNALQVPYPGAPVLINPGSLNLWLEGNGGYTCAAGDCNNLVLNAVERLAPAQVALIGELPPPPFAEIAEGLRNGTVAYIAHVAALHHFVLLEGVDHGSGGANFTVRDSFYNATSYALASFSDIIMFRLRQGAR